MDIDELLALIRVDNHMAPETKEKALNELRTKWGYVPQARNGRIAKIFEQPSEKRKPYKMDRRTRLKKRREYYHKRKAQDGDYNLNWDRSLKGQFYRLRREYVKKRGIAWTLTLSQWCQMWMSCEPILVGTNVYKPAWKCRGRTIQDVRLFRLDKDKPFEINNLEVRYKDKVLWRAQS